VIEVGLLTVKQSLKGAVPLQVALTVADPTFTEDTLW
jgi:hypothetical protein